MSAREQIIKAADGLFGKVGFDAATTREIAELSGVNKALIHYHFQSKEALFESVLDNYYRRLNQTLMTELTRDGDLKEKIGRVVDVYVDFLYANRNFSRIVQRESAGEKHLARIRDHLLPMFQTGTGMIKGAYPHTRAGELSAHQLLFSFYGMIVVYFTYSGVVEHLLGKNPLSKKGLENRRAHLHRMIDIIMSEVENAERKYKRTPRTEKGGSHAKSGRSKK